MKFGALLTALIILFSAVALALPDFSEAARMGGGRSFGSRPSMSVPAQRPTMNNNFGPSASRSAAATAQKPGMFGGMGGIFGGLLAGTLLGSLLSGNGFGGGGGFMDILLLGILAFIAYKLFMRFRNRQAQSSQNAPAYGGSGAGNPFGGQTAGGPFGGNGGGFSSPMRREDASGGGWDNLRGGAASPYATQGNVNIPPDFNADEFLRGAKMAYNRMQKAWDRRDLDDIAQFVTPAVFNVLKEQAASDPNPSNTEIMLVNAQLMGVEKEGDEERAQVYFDVTMREDPGQQTPEQAREIWHFVRVGANGEWKLDGIQQVD